MNNQTASLEDVPTTARPKEITSAFFPLITYRYLSAAHCDSVLIFLPLFNSIVYR